MDLSQVKELYDRNLEEYGIDPRSVGWTKPGSQELRFEKLLQVVQDKTEPFTLNELGCGYGEIYKYCLNEGFSVSQYFGYDISEKMIEAAQGYLGKSEQIKLFHNSSIQRKADYSVTSGIFNVNFVQSEADWKKYIIETLHNLYEFSEKGFSFNLLSKYVDYKIDHLYYGDPCEFFEYCKRNLSKKVNLIHDYDLFEWTIIVKK